ncbi:GerAB/ArcD/ProY family transporter [Bacillus sp. CLL-7-23]|uniref:GerAB/ArcD/ProY family transporter n=1 Tax=Bacillus changyiensis TaxID=3004103 RepID=A0ABT4X2F1_9BACI|nr:GerAB/ArcD/ProY family transporter [Bacillus changyiensis]MDA7026473.1 GerAB/ArcD/ProY family transporter [Bacillus changyiensis]
MEKAKISAKQLFVLMVLFELGSALLIFPGLSGKQDSWLAILFGGLGGIILFLMYHYLYQLDPNASPYETVSNLLGQRIGWIVSFLYIMYATYIAARVLRDFGEMLLISAYPGTPLLFVNGLLIIVCIFSVRKGIEVLARTGEILFTIMTLLALIGCCLIIASGLIHIDNLKPVLGNGIKPVINSTLTQTLYFPFGELIVFIVILPYLNRPKEVRKTGIWAIIVSALILAVNTATNISVLGVDLTLRSRFPLLSTIQTIQVAEFLDRLDVFFMLVLIIGGFFKVSLFVYAVNIGASMLFKVEHPTRLVVPSGLIILILSVSIASNISEHVVEGLDIAPMFVHLPIQIIFPAVLCLIAFFKKRKKGR